MSYFIKALIPRFGVEMWSDKRLLNKESAFCLCTSCKRSYDHEKGQPECLLHKDFMQATRYLQVGAPIFACLEFEENTVISNEVLGNLYAPTQEQVETYKGEGWAQFMKDWDAQKGKEVS